jgi:mono/diheme cytochrome c family protein
MNHRKRAVIGAMAAYIMTSPVVGIATADPVAAKAGQLVYDKWCAPCHDPGIIHPGTHALMAKYANSKPAVLKEWTDLDPLFLRYTVRHGVSIMPQFRKTEITDAELGDLVAYLTHQQ